jgi:glutamate:GABA antiporter
VITLIGLLYALIPSVSRAYWIFAAQATEVYLIMYVLMFVAARNLRRRQPDHARGHQCRRWQRSAQTGPSPPSVPA